MGFNGGPREAPQPKQKLTEQNLLSPEVRARKLVDHALKKWGPDWRKGVWDPDAKDKIQAEIAKRTKERNDMKAAAGGLEKKAQSNPLDVGELEVYRNLLRALQRSETELAHWKEELHLFDRAELLFKYHQGPYIALHRQRLIERSDKLRQAYNELLHKQIDPKKRERVRLMRDLSLKRIPAEEIQEKLAAFYEKNLKPLEARYNNIAGELREAEQELSQFNALGSEEQFYAALGVSAKGGGEGESTASEQENESEDEIVGTPAADAPAAATAAGGARRLTVADGALTTASAGQRDTTEHREASGENEAARAIRLGEAYLDKHGITGSRYEALAQMLGLEPKAKVDAAWVSAARKFQAGKLDFPARDKAKPAEIAAKKVSDGIIGDVSLAAIRDTDWPEGGKPNMAALVKILFPEGSIATSAASADTPAEAKAGPPAAPAERVAQAEIPEPQAATPPERKFLVEFPSIRLDTARLFTLEGNVVYEIGPRQGDKTTIVTIVPSRRGEDFISAKTQIVSFAALAAQVDKRATKQFLANWGNLYERHQELRLADLQNLTDARPPYEMYQGDPSLEGKDHYAVRVTKGAKIIRHGKYADYTRTTNADYDGAIYLGTAPSGEVLIQYREGPHLRRGYVGRSAISQKVAVRPTPKSIPASAGTAGKIYGSKNVTDVVLQVKDGKTLRYRRELGPSPAPYTLQAGSEITVLAGQNLGNARVGEIVAVLIHTPEGKTEKVYVDGEYLKKFTDRASTSVAKWFEAEEPKPAAAQTVDHHDIAEYLFDNGIARLLVQLGEVAELKDKEGNFKDGVKVALPVVIAEGEPLASKLVYLSLTFRSNSGNPKWEVAGTLHDEEYIAQNLQLLATNCGIDKIPPGVVSPEKLEQAYLAAAPDRAPRLTRRKAELIASYLHDAEEAGVSILLARLNDAKSFQDGQRIALPVEIEEPIIEEKLRGEDASGTMPIKDMRPKLVYLVLTKTDKAGEWKVGDNIFDEKTIGRDLYELAINNGVDALPEASREVLNELYDTFLKIAKSPTKEEQELLAAVEKRYSEAA